MIDPFRLLMFFSSTIILSYFSSLIYRRTRIPDIVILLGFGVLLGPVLGWLDEDIFIEVAPLVGVISISIITFDAGMDSEMELLREILPKTSALTLATFTTLTIGVGAAIRIIMPGLGLLEGLLLGTMLSGISTVAIISILDDLEKIIPDLESVRVLLVFESTLVDPIRIIIALTLIRMMTRPGFHPFINMRDIYAILTIASFMGVLLGLLWSLILNGLRNMPYNFMLTLAVLFVIYYLGENVAGQGGGTMATFMFGLILSNHQYLTNRFGLKLRLDTYRIKEFNKEIAFLMKSYYFVYIGIIVSITQEFILIGLGLTGLIIILRYLVVSGVGYLLNFSNEELVISRLSFPLGTSALVLSQLPLIYDPHQLAITNPRIYPSLIFPVVLGTVIFTALTGPTLAKWRLERIKGKEEK